MKVGKLFLAINLLMLCLSMTGCRRSNDVWEDSRTAGRYLGRGVKALGGKQGNSRAVASRDQFDPSNPYQNGYGRGVNEDFIPLSDGYQQDEISMADSISIQPRENPGDPGSSVPGIDSFRDANTIPGMSGIFKNITFGYNNNLVKGQENLNTVHAIADYMKRNPNTYIFVEGHCDERGPEAFNLALGSRRSNAVRNLLISEGVNPDNIFTISYGKERPLVFEHHEEAWSVNRRAEFKIYQR